MKAILKRFFIATLVTWLVLQVTGWLVQATYVGLTGKNCALQGLFGCTKEAFYSLIIFLVVGSFVFIFTYKKLK